MSIKPKENLHKNINEIRAQEYGVDDDNKPIPDSTPNPATQQDTPTYKPWGWDVIGSRKSAGHRHDRARLSDWFQKTLYT